MAKMSILQPSDDRPSRWSPVGAAPGTHLPRSLTSFIGREGEVAAVCALLLRPGVRLLTLTGPGGIGKSRMALQVARSVDAFPDGTWFVDLAPIFDDRLVGVAIGRALGIPQVGDVPIERGVIDFLRDLRALLILDNFEQVVAAGPLLTKVLTTCPEVKAIVTSRAPLRVSGEQCYLVPPLALPDADQRAWSDNLQSVEAVQLFVERAAARSAGFTLTPDNASAVVGICRRLDGVPLAIELAAARSNVLTPTSMLRRLDERLTFLAEGPQDVPERLRSMADSIAWSYDLLAPGEQRLFRQLGALVGAWTLDAAEAVAGEDDASSPVFERLAALVDTSLVRQDQDERGASTYRMLATVWEYASACLDASDEADAVNRRHAAFITELAERAELASFLPDGARVIHHLRTHLSNVPKALAWLERQGDVDGMLRLAGTVDFYCRAEGQLQHGRRLAAWAVEQGRGVGSRWLADALVTLASFAYIQGDLRLARATCDEGLELIDQATDVFTRFRGYTSDGLIALGSGDTDRAVAAQERNLALLRSIPEAEWTARAESTVLGHLGNIAVGAGDIDAAERWFEQALERQRALGYAPGTSHNIANHPIAGLGDVARARGDLPLALTHYRDALSLALRFHDARAAAYALGGVAGTLAASGNWQIAARLFGADEAYHTLTGFHFDLQTMDRQRALGLPEPWLRAGEPFGAGQPLRDALWADRAVPLPPIPDPAQAAELWAEGRQVSLAEAAAEAMAMEIEVVSAPVDPAVDRGLTRREGEVLRLLAEGRSNRSIADTLSLSERTVENHVLHILTKLDLESRTAAATWALRHGLT